MLEAAARSVLAVGDLMLDAKSDDAAAAALSEAHSIPSLAALGRSHWLPSRMAAQPKSLIIVPAIIPAPADVLPAVEPSEAPVNPKSDDASCAPPADASRDEADGKHMTSAADLRGGRRFGAGALFVSALAGSAMALATLLTFGLSHARWEHAFEHQAYAAYAEVIEPRPTDMPMSRRTNFADVVAAYEPAEFGIPGILSTRPTDSSTARDQIEVSGEGEEQRTVFSSAILGTPFAPGEVSVEGTVLASGSSVLAPDYEAARDVPSQDEPAVETVSFDTFQLAGVFEASNSSAAGAVLSDSSDAIGLPTLASGKIVVDRLSSSIGDKAMDAETAVLSIPAGAKKVDAVVHIVTADGRLAYVSDLSVVLEDKIRPATERQTRRSAQRKASPGGKATETSKTNLPNRRTSQRLQPLPPAPRRGLFNFNSYFGSKKDNSADSDRRGAAG